VCGLIEFEKSQFSNNLAARSTGLPVFRLIAAIRETFMQLLKQVNQWFSKYKNSFFLYKDGFFELPYLANSPETILQSIRKMPFVKHYKGQQLVKSKTPLLSGGFYYEKFSDGLWIIQGDFKYKANIIHKRVNDASLTSDYYFLSLKVFGIEQKNALMNGVAYTNCSWQLFKPNTWFTNCQFKGAKELSLTIFFNENWLKTVFYKDLRFAHSSIKDFFESDAKYIIWPDDYQNIKKNYHAIYDNFKNTQSRSEIDRAELKELVYEMIFRFIHRYKSDGINASILQVPDWERIAIYKAEKFLLNNLSCSFPGIELLAKEVGVSATKLKASFKLVFGKTTFQYFQEKQMVLAKEILLQNRLPIKDLAKSMGYENASKFSAAFRKQNGMLPSEIL
jgi:AraC-like DNA-binding protein